jgi:ribonuclease BN (tRNA processing enzyme)
MKLTILGSGTDASQLPGIPNRYPPGFLVEWGNEKLLFECSEGIRFRLERVGIDFTSISNLAISHSHPDHYALPQFYQSIWNTAQWSKMSRAEHELNIYASSQLNDNFSSLWSKFHPDLPNMLPLPHLNFVAMENSKSVKIGEAKLLAFPVFHGFGKVGALAFRLEMPDKKVLVYSGDTGECEGIRKAAERADIFICEASARIGDEESPKKYGHLNPFVAGDIALKSNVKKIIFFHYTGLDSDQAIIKECQRSGFSGEIVVGKDFQTFEI